MLWFTGLKDASVSQWWLTEINAFPVWGIGPWLVYIEGSKAFPLWNRDTSHINQALLIFSWGQQQTLILGPQTYLVISIPLVAGSGGKETVFACFLGCFFFPFPFSFPFSICLWFRASAKCPSLIGQLVSLWFSLGPDFLPSLSVLRADLVSGRHNSFFILFS